MAAMIKILRTGSTFLLCVVAAVDGGSRKEVCAPPAPFNVSGRGPETIAFLPSSFVVPGVKWFSMSFIDTCRISSATANRPVINTVCRDHRNNLTFGDRYLYYFFEVDTFRFGYSRIGYSRFK